MKRCRVNRKILNLLIFVYIIFNSVLHLILKIPVLDLADNIILFFIITLVYNGNMRSRIFCLSMIYIINMLYEGLSHIILDSVGFSMIYSKIIIYSITILGLYITEQILKRIFNRDGFYYLELKYLFILLIIPIGSIYLAVNILLLYEESIICLISTSVLIFINISVFYIFNEISKSYKKKHEDSLLIVENRCYKNEIDILKKSEEKTAKVRHDYKNHILSIKGYIANGDIVNADLYLNNIINDLKVENRIVSSGNMVVDSLFNYKLGNLKDIDYNLKIVIPEELFISEYHLNTILGNLIDNSLEALEKCDKKYLEVVIKYNRGILYIKFKNNYNGITIKNNKLFVTTKNDKFNHGYGVKNIKEAVNFYNGEMDFNIDDKFFEVNVILYNNDEINEI